MTIPPIIHRLWLGGPEPEWTRPFAATWQQPGWELCQWTDDNVGELFPLANQDVYDRAEEIAPDHVGQLRSDVLRYELLHRHGGVWVDADFECVRRDRFAELVDGVECFAAWEQARRWVGNTIMGAAPGHPFIGALVDGLAANVKKHAGLKPNRLTGPQFVTSTWLRQGEGVKIFDRELFYPFSYRDVAEYQPGTFDPAEKWPGAVACHWWRNRRRERGLL